MRQHQGAARRTHGFLPKPKPGGVGDRIGVDLNSRRWIETRRFRARICSRRSSLMRPARSSSMRATRCIGSSPAIRTACRSSSCMAARAPERRRPIAASSTRSLPHHRLRSARRRPLDAAGRARATTRRAHLIADIEALARHPRHRALGGVRRLLGLDPGARLCRGPSRALPRPHPARHLPLPPERDRLVPLRHAHGFPGGVAQFRRLHSRERARAICSAPIIAASIDPNPAVHMPAARAWSTYEGACSTLLPSPDTVAAFGEDRMALGLARIEAHYFRCNDLISRPTICSRISTASAKFRRRSCRAATTWSARSSTPTSWPAPGRRRSISSCPMPAIRRWSRESARSSSPPPRVLKALR